MTSDSMNFTIIIATSGRTEKLQHLFRYLQCAVLRLGDPATVIVVDNDPGYRAESTVKQWPETMGMKVVYLKSEPRNKSAALNAGIQAAQTDWLAFTDDDTEPDAEWLVMGRQYLKISGVRIAGGHIVPGALPTDLPAWLVAGPSGRLPHGGVFVQYEPRPSSGVLRPADPIPFGANIFVHKSIFRDYGMYDEQLWRLCGKAALGVDDGEFGVRIKNALEPIGYCHEALVVHPVHRERESVCDHLRIAYRYGWRDPMVFFDAKRPLIEWFRFKRMVLLAARACHHGLKNDPAGAVADLVEAVKCLGALCNRWSIRYRQWAKFQAQHCSIS